MHTRTKRNIRKMAAGISAFAVLAMPLSVGATANQQQQQSVSNYKAHLQQLNDTGVNGQVHLQHRSDGSSHQTLWVKLKAHGTQPDKVHPVHIHGNEHPEVAFCPTNAQDANNDGFVSVVEGAATYGPIKLNLTSPQTPFGTPPTPALFTPFAGTPETGNFPSADGDGNVHLNQTYVFDDSEAAHGALATLMPLENQHIVIHGADAPASVDADAFAALGLPASDPKSVIYDPLLPIACGEIDKVGHQVHPLNQNGNQHENNNNQQQNNQEHAAPVQHTDNQNAGQHQNDQKHADGQGAVVHENQNNNQGGRGQEAQQTAAQTTQHTDAVAAFHARMAELMQHYMTAKQAAHDKFEAHKNVNHAEARDHYVDAVQAARDQYVNHYYEARNKMVDQLNQSGHTQLRDETMQQADHKLMQWTHEFETMKQDFLNQHNW